MSHVIESPVLVQFVKYEQFGARALRSMLPCGSPSRAGSSVNGAWPTGNGRSSGPTLGAISSSHAAALARKSAASSGNCSETSSP